GRDRTAVVQYRCRTQQQRAGDVERYSSGHRHCADQLEARAHRRIAGQRDTSCIVDDQTVEAAAVGREPAGVEVDELRTGAVPYHGVCAARLERPREGIAAAALTLTLHEVTADLDRSGREQAVGVAAA